ncbi:MAG: endonuclease III domain-containing protein [Nitrospirota bacterium]
MTNRQIHSVIAELRRVVRGWPTPAVGVVAQETRDPFRVLVSCLLSLRTKDATTAAASTRMFALATTPDALARLSSTAIERAIYPVAFYRTKARSLRALSAQLLTRFQGTVPDTIDELLSLPGVGRKTANLVVTIGFGKPGICVDTHVHRITNRWGYVATKSPDETERVLRRKLPRSYWIEFNDLLVPYGQFLCTPTSPFCGRCSIARWCRQTAVTRRR